ncbi:MAG: hypothetical protein Fur0020_08530 [Thermodesulfovibrionia bacterium]
MLNKVVARYKDGRLIKGKTNDFSVNKPRFHIEVDSGKSIGVRMEALRSVEINVDELKAAFFVKDLEGDRRRRDIYEDIISGGGRKVRVRFFDGEEIIGYAHSYDPNRLGFFIVPADIKSNNQRIFVVNSAIEKVEFI